MPIREYMCRSCGKKFEVIQYKKRTKIECPDCGNKKVSILISKTNFQLLGDGWAKDGYSKTSKNGK